MDSYKELKRLFEFQSCASAQQEVSQIEADRAEAKRQRRAPENTGDDFEEFVALLDEIQYMKTNHKNFGILEEISMPEDSDVKVMPSKSPWIPSFEWEDFSGFAAKGTMSAHSSLEKEKIRKSIPSNDLNQRCSSDDKSPAESFDLNVEASSSHTISGGF